MGLLDTYLGKALEAEATAKVEAPIANSLANKNNVEAFCQLRSVVTPTYSMETATADYVAFVSKTQKATGGGDA